MHTHWKLCTYSNLVHPIYSFTYFINRKNVKVSQLQFFSNIIHYHIDYLSIICKCVSQYANQPRHYIRGWQTKIRRMIKEYVTLLSLPEQDKNSSFYCLDYNRIIAFRNNFFIKIHYSLYLHEINIHSLEDTRDRNKNGTLSRVSMFFQWKHAASRNYKTSEKLSIFIYCIKNILHVQTKFEIILKNKLAFPFLKKRLNYVQWKKETR